MNYHQRSFSEQPQPLWHQQQSQSLSANTNTNNNNNNNGDNNNNTSNNIINGSQLVAASPNGGGVMDTTMASRKSTTGEILHSDSQQSLDRLFNPASMPSYTPLRDRNLPASFFNPPRNQRGAAGESDGGPPVSTFHSRSISFDQRQTVKAPTQRRNINLHMRTQSTLAPMTGQTASMADPSQSAIMRVASASNGHLNSDFGSSEIICSPQNSLHASTEFTAAHVQHPAQANTHTQQHHHDHHHQHQQQQQHQQSNFVHQNNHCQRVPVVARTSVVHGHGANQQPATNYNQVDGNFVENQPYQHHHHQQQQPLNNNVMPSHQSHSHEPKFYVAHSTYVTPAQGAQTNQQQHQPQQQQPGAVAAGPFNSISHSCSDSDFYSGSCSSLHSRSQSCQSSALDSSMSNLGISGSSNDLASPIAAQTFDYAASNTQITHHHHHQQQHQHHQHQHQSIANGPYNPPVQNHQMFPAQATLVNHHHQQHFQNPIPGFHQQQTIMGDRRCGY